MSCAFTAVDSGSARDASLELDLLSEAPLEVAVDLPLADERPVAALGVPLALRAAVVRVGSLDSLEDWRKIGCMNITQGPFKGIPSSRNLSIQRVASDHGARFCIKVFKIFHRLVGRYCSYLLMKKI